jgi:hypothetical protein
VPVPPEADDPEPFPDDAAPLVPVRASAGPTRDGSAPLAGTPVAGTPVAGSPGEGTAAAPWPSSRAQGAPEAEAGASPAGRSGGAPLTVTATAPGSSDVVGAAVPTGASVTFAGDDLHHARRAVADVLSALLHARTAEAPAVPHLTPAPLLAAAALVTPAPLLAAAALVAPAPLVEPVPSLPVQRSAEPPVDGLQALQLLAEGLDLFSPSSS